MYLVALFLHIFFFNDTATTEIYTLSLHDALPIFLIYRSTLTMHEDEQLFLDESSSAMAEEQRDLIRRVNKLNPFIKVFGRSEEHTSELQSHVNLVCRLLLEKKKKKTTQSHKSITS